MREKEWKKRYHVGKVSTGLVLMVLILAGADGISAQPEQAPESAPVRATPAIRREVKPYVRLIGTSGAFRRSVVASEVEGRVVAMEARRAQAVDRNGVLARIDRTRWALQLKQARAELREVQQTYQNAVLELKRTRTLYQEKSVSSRQYDDARFQASALENRIAALQARIESIEFDLTRCVVRAPFAGFVVEEYTEEGEWAKEGGAIAEIVDIDPLLVTVPVPDRYVLHVAPDQTFAIRFQGLNRESEQEGTVRGVVPKGNEAARTFPVEILVPNPEGDLFAGLSCEVRIPVGPAESRLLVHKDAVVAGGEGYHIFVVREGRAVFVPVEKGLAYEGFVAVRGEVRDTEPVVTEGNERLRPGQPVHILD